jgi:hypothetical protein
MRAQLTPIDRYDARDQSGPELSTFGPAYGSPMQGMVAASKFPGAVGRLMRQLRGPASGIAQNRTVARHGR